MPHTVSRGVRIWWEEEGEGPPIVLLHGYTSNLRTHWRASGWFEHLAANHRVIALDQRGHGRSEKPRQRDSYSRSLMAADVAAVLDAAGVERATLFGYSMGAIVGTQTLLDYPARFDGAILGGMGVQWEVDGRRQCPDEEHPGAPRPHRDLQRSASAVTSWLRHYNPFAMRALAQGVFFGQDPMPAARLSEIDVPVLSVSGTRDRFCAGTKLLPSAITNCRRVVLTGQTHISTVSDPRFKAAVSEFLAELHPDA